MKVTLALIIILQGIVAHCQNKMENKMIHLLKNDNLEIQIDLPMANYNFSRFDWTGKIVSVKYKDIFISGTEGNDSIINNAKGRGFYNEFGIDRPVGFDDIEEGEFFHKIGIGLLKKEGITYDFSKKYEIDPATFKVTSEVNIIRIECISQYANGYSYILIKEIELLENGFVVRYHLQNTGEKTIITDEYNHNFLAINKELLGNNYILKFPFRLNQELFSSNVNPEGIVEIGQDEITFNDTPEQQFFFSDLSGGKNVQAYWELLNKNAKIGLSETGNFKTKKINLWGWQHVISPELFYDLKVEPGQSVGWSRTYHVFEIL
jgi:hypothetical protein